MPVCPRCSLPRDVSEFRKNRRPCVHCIREDGRVREAERRLVQGDVIRERDRARSKDPQRRAAHKEISRLSAERIRRAAGVQPKRVGLDPAKLAASRARSAAKRRVPPDQGKLPKYSSDEERIAARKARRNGPAGAQARAAHAVRERQKRRADPEGVRDAERIKARVRRAANPDKMRAKGLRDEQRRRARLAGADVRMVTERDLRRLEDRQRGRCFYCADGPSPLTMDHVIPIARGGRHAIGNLVLACEKCNKSKGSRLLVEWVRL